MEQNGESGSLTFLGKLVMFLFVAGSMAGAVYFLFYKNAPGAGSAGAGATQPGTTVVASTGSPQKSLQIGIAYGTEKKEWLKWAVEQFSQTPDGKNIKVNLIPFGSLEGAQAILGGNKEINVWTPASAVYTNTFEVDWNIKYGTKPFVKQEALALTPMVFVMWEERYQAFIQKYKVLNFKTIGQALQEKGGWDALAQKPEWGLFKFGHTHPNLSNSGLVTLLLMAHEFYNKPRQLDVKDLTNVEFQTWMENVERGVSGLSNSTGTMMREMILKGPSAFDVLFVYESVVIEQLRNAQGRWGNLRVVYPALNMWNDNPYYIVNATWNTPDQQKAAETFMNFLLSEPIQTQALTHGFRPANLNVPTKGENSPFALYQKYGLSVDLSNAVEPPKAEVITNLLTGWQRTQGGR